MKTMITAALAALILLPTGALAQAICAGFGPQTPRDITAADGENARVFPLAPASAKMNLCNIHTHTNAEHKGPGFSVFAGAEPLGGYQCNESDSLTEDELEDIHEGHGPYGNVKPGDTIEVHWVYTSCAANPGPTLGSCLNDACANPTLRVESQVFLLVNDDSALSFLDFVYAGNMVGDLHQPKALPTGTGDPVVFAGSTTGPSYNQSKCSPFQVTWSVRPSCAKLDINSLHAWAEAGNVFGEYHSHGVRQLVTAPELLAPIN